MAYKMEYGIGEPTISTTRKIIKRKKPSVRKLVVFGILIALLVVCTTTDILIPGDAAVTKAAMGNFLSDIRGGEQVVDAFAAFCQTVLQGG